MAKEIIYLTAEGYKKLKDELDHMRSVERPAISAAIAEARDKGDLSENAEYDAAQMCIRDRPHSDRSARYARRFVLARRTDDRLLERQQPLPLRHRRGFRASDHDGRCLDVYKRQMKRVRLPVKGSSPAAMP